MKRIRAERAGQRVGTAASETSGRFRGTVSYETRLTVRGANAFLDKP